MTTASTRPADRIRRRGIAARAVVLLALVGAGCATPKARDRGTVSQAVQSRFGADVGRCSAPDRVIVPDGLADGRPVSEEQAVVLALWNNAAFREALIELDLTRADLIQAKLLPNPEFVYFWPEFDKPFKYLVDFPLESLWLRPLRIKAAAAENERAAAKLTQLALDLIRDTRQAYADLRLAHERLKVAERAMTLRKRVLELAEARLKEGDASPLEVSTARIDALQINQDLIRARGEVPVAEERLRNLTGLSRYTVSLVPDSTPFDPRTEIPPEEMVAEAVQTRPDAVAATQAAAAAAERTRLAKVGWVRLLGLLDATSGKLTGHEFGPAVRMTLPIFNHNQGGIARARAEQDQLEHRRQTVHNQVVLDVKTAYARYRQARTELDFLRQSTRPEVETAIRRVEAAYKEGNVTYLIVLESNRQLIDTYAREAVLDSELRRAWAELERSIGRRLQ